MSVNTATSSLLPNLPGYRTKEFKTGSKKQFFTLVGGQVFLRDQYNNPVKEEYVGDEGSLSTIGSPVKKTFHHDKQGLVLTFQAYFEESPDGGNTSQIRKCMVLFYLEDNTLKIVEKPSLNSGVTQGTLVRRAIINKPDGTPYNESDFYIGDYVIVYGRQYRLIDCDKATRKYLGFDDNLSFSAPRDSYEEYRSTLQAGHDDSWGKFHSKKNANKTFIEAILGNSADNSGREGFMRFGTKTLQFRCIWDNTDQLYGDVMEFCLKYYLADDTLEIFSIPSKLSGGKDGNKSKLLKRAKLPKNFRDTMDLQKVPEDSSFFHWSDFYIGMELKVYGRYLKIMDADGPTREFFQLAEAPLGPGLFLPEPDVVVHQREVPPPTGFGSEEDSLRSCNGPLMPGRAPAKRQGESRILSFFACLLSGGLDDVDRRFVISYYIQDGHIKITEPPIRNSGFTGGLFLSKRAVKLENGEAMKETDLFIGCRLKVLKHEFLLLDANEGTLRWMEDKSLPRSNYYSILEKIRPFLMEDAVSGALSKSFASFEKPVNHDGLGGPGYATKEDLAAILSQYNLMGQHRDDVSEHEIRTIVRGAGNRTPFFAYEKFIQQIIHPTDEFK